MRKAKAIFLSLLYSKGVGQHHLNFDWDSKAGRGWESFIVRKGQALGVPWLEAMGMRKLETGELEAGDPCNSLGVHVWLFLVGPKLEAGEKIRETVSY